MNCIMSFFDLCLDAIRVLCGVEELNLCLQLWVEYSITKLTPLEYECASLEVALAFQQGCRQT